jgi:HD-GYP domain-containing protein (c-di-GMP phosphodiesterase class II)
MNHEHGTPQAGMPDHVSAEAYLETIRMLAAALDAVDPFTRGRSYRVSRFCRAVGRRLDLSSRELRDLEFAALLHDIGRVAILHDVLLKPAALSQADRVAVHTHPEVGYDILRRVPELVGAAALVRAHHEQPDGCGYPQGLSGNEIPLGSRVLAILASFDAMTTDRPYRRGRSCEEAYEELRAHSGTMFDAAIVGLVVSLHQSGELFEDFERDNLNSPDHILCRALERWRTNDPAHSGPGPSPRGRSGEISVQIIDCPVDPLAEDGNPRRVSGRMPRAA